MDTDLQQNEHGSMQVVYEGHYALSDSNDRPNLLRVVVDYHDGAVFVVRSESRVPEPALTNVSRFYEPQDDDWRAGHGVAFDEACQHLQEVIDSMNRGGYRELPSSPGWTVPAPCAFANYLIAERARHPLPVMH